MKEKRNLFYTSYPRILQYFKVLKNFCNAKNNMMNLSPASLFITILLSVINLNTPISIVSF